MQSLGIQERSPMMDEPSNSSRPSASLMKIHLIGGLVCVLIAGASVAVSGNAVSKRRGIFLNARHELASVKGMLSGSAGQRASLDTRVHRVEKIVSDQVHLYTAKMLNTRTAEIVELAESVRMRVDSLQPTEMITDQRVPVQPLQLVGEANADAVYKFLEIIRTQMPDIHVQSIDLKSASLDTPTVGIEIKFYWFVDPAG